MVESTQRVIVFEYDYRFGIDSIQKAKEFFLDKKAKGVIEGSFEDEMWIGNNQLKKIGISFHVDKNKYYSHGFRQIGVDTSLLGVMLRSFVLLTYEGVYTFQLIQKRTNLLVEFLEKIGEPQYYLSPEDVSAIENFLIFIDLPPERVTKICKLIHKKKARKPSVRMLEKLTTYMVLNDEIEYLYDNSIDDETFVKWFPVYFWVKLTFVLPLRATETVVTPFDCIQRISDEQVYLLTRVTKLKRHLLKVYYDVDRDYEIVSYSLDYSYPRVKKLIDIIEKYQKLTRDHGRVFLFDYGENNINNYFSLVSLNNLISKFMDKYIIGNLKYDFVRYETHIEEFNYVTAGDSRPLALQNVYFQDFSLDISRQLAKHMSSQTTSGYIRNISHTIMASSVMKVQKMHMFEREKKERKENGINTVSTNAKEGLCTSLKRIANPQDISDCIEQRCLEECYGCSYYRASENDVKKICKEREILLDKQSERMRKMLSNVDAAKKSGINIDYEFLNMQTTMQRFKDSYVGKSEMDYRKWRSKE